MEAKKFIRTFFIWAGGLLLAAAAAVAVMDPFYQTLTSFRDANASFI